MLSELCSPIAYLDQASLKRLADKNALDEYLKQEQIKSQDVRFLMTPELRQSIRTLVKDLPERERDLIYMRYWEELSIEEISSHCDLEPKVVRELLNKTLAKLKIEILNSVSHS